MPHRHFSARLGARAALLGLAFSTSVWADVLTVGPGCQYGELQTAIDATHGSVNEIHVHADYHGKPVRISNKTLRIYGGYPSCNAPAPIPFAGNLEDLTWLDGGLDGSAKPVIAIDGQASLDLRNFLIGGGHDDGHNGGGIQFNSSGNFGHLELHAVDVNGNRADKGGGIFFHGGASVNELFLFDYSTIRSNIAHDAGGGIRLEGNTYLLANSPYLSIDHNSADPSNSDDGTGGGIQMLDTTSADIGSPGYDIYAPINSNEAKLGGGIALLDNAQARFYTTVANAPPRIENNHAAAGGGVFLKGAVRLCIAGGGINANTTVGSGGAVWVHEAAGEATLKIGTECNQPPGALTCPQGVPCNTVDANIAGGDIVGGGSFSGLTLDFDNIALRNNHGTVLIETAPQTFNGQISNCNISANELDSILISAGTKRTTLDFCTIAENSIHNDWAFATAAPLSLVNTIIWQPTKQTFDRTPFDNSRMIDVITQDASTLAPGQFETFTNVRQIDPLFASDLHLLPSSPAIDYSTTGDRSVDLDFRRRPIDIQGTGPGPYDIGAYEHQPRGTFPPGENFDELGQMPTLPSDWNEGHSGDNPGWTITGTGADTGPYAAYVEDKQGFADLITPLVHIDASTRQLRFRHRVSLGGNTTVDNDAVTLFVNVDGSLFTVPQLGGHFTRGAPNACNGQCWTGDHSAYETVTAELPASLIGKYVRFYWSFGYLGDNPGLAGYWLDSITLEASDSIFVDGFDP